MTDLKPCPFCGGEAVLETDHDTIQPVAPIDWKRVRCNKCNIRTTWRKSEAEAIEACNRMTNDHFRGVTKMVERTAKVQELPRRSETSLDWEGICSNCGAYTNHDMNYCFECGAKLEWSDHD